MKDLDLVKRAEVEEQFDFRKWDGEIPFIEFREGWWIKMRPPFGNAIVRFSVTTSEISGDISVYLDCYHLLGIYGKPGDPEPYWEIYPSDDGDVERFAMEDTESLIDGIKRSIEYLKSHEQKTQT